MNTVDRMILDFEKSWWRRIGEKETAIQETFSMSPVTYYRRLNALLDEPEALEAEPVLINRLRRVRDSRARVRRVS